VRRASVYRFLTYSDKKLKMTVPNIVVVVPLLSILAAALVTDIASRRIPNGLSLGGAAVGLVANATLTGPSGLVFALLGCLLCLALFMPMYAGAGMAAGDVKLMAMVGAFLGPVNGFVACACTLVAGGALASIWIAWRNIHERVVGDAEPALADRLGISALPRTPLDKLPYAAAIALGTTVTAFQPVWLMAMLPEGVLP
jgi:prepilin peptidase CpaA